MVEKLVDLLIRYNLTVTTAESCTGGMISATLVNVPGVSSVLNEAYVTYANASKIKLLSVSKKTLDEHGAVSYNTAYEMVKGAANAANADCAIAVTGIAGPDGGTKEKPVGTVYSAIYVNGTIKVTKHHFDGDRYEVRKQTTDCVLELLYNEILEYFKDVKED